MPQAHPGVVEQSNEEQPCGDEAEERTRLQEFSLSSNRDWCSISAVCNYAVQGLKIIIIIKEVLPVFRKDHLLRYSYLSV